MTIQKTITLYEFDELPTKAAKTKAREWYRECLDSNDVDHVMDDFAQIAELLGITLRQRAFQTLGGSTRHEPDVSWELHVQGAGASFAGSWRCEPDGVFKIAEYAPQDIELSRIAGDLAKYPGYSATCKLSRNSSHSRSAEIEVFESDGHEADATPSEVISEALRDLMDWLYKAINAEWDYQSSDDAIDENLRGNGYYFTAVGKRCDP